MKPAWDKLGDEFKDSKTVIIADVDCTIEKDLCQKYGVRGYPTIKTFTSSSAAMGDAYEGGRDYDALAKFAKESLGPTCSPENLDLCDDAQKAGIAEAQSMSTADRAAEIEKIQGEVDAANTAQEELLKSLQSQYEAGKTKTEETIAASTPRLRLLRSVKSNDDKEL